MIIFAAIIDGAIGAIRIALVARILIDWVRLLRPQMKPTGVSLALLSVPYILTDWVVKPLRRLIKPIRIGRSYLDISLIVLFFVLAFIQNLLVLFLQGSR